MYLRLTTFKLMNLLIYLPAYLYTYLFSCLTLGCRNKWQIKWLRVEIDSSHPLPHSHFFFSELDERKRMYNLDMLCFFEVKLELQVLLKRKEEVTLSSGWQSGSPEYPKFPFFYVCFDRLNIARLILFFFDWLVWLSSLATSCGSIFAYLEYCPGLI